MNNGKNGVILPLKQWRIKQYMTYKALALKAGVSIDVLQRAEKGKPISEISKLRIVDALGIEVCQVVEWAQAE